MLSLVQESVRVESGSGVGTCGVWFRSRYVLSLVQESVRVESGSGVGTC